MKELKIPHTKLNMYRVSSYFYPDGKIKKHEGIEGIKFMEVISNMEDEKTKDENDPEISLVGNERYNPPPPIEGDNRPDPEAGRKIVPLQDSGDGTNTSGMVFTKKYGFGRSNEARCQKIISLSN